MIILGKDGKEYDSVKACLNADKLFEQKQQEEEARKEAERRAQEDALAQKKAQISKRKKELSSTIEIADQNVKTARSEYDAAVREAKELVSKAKEQASKLISEADAKLKLATKEKAAAITAFNKEFGTYTTVLTGDAAWDEYSNMVKEFDSTFNLFNQIFKLF